MPNVWSMRRGRLLRAAVVAAAFPLLTVAVPGGTASGSTDQTLDDPAQVVTWMIEAGPANALGGVAAETCALTSCAVARLRVALPAPTTDPLAVALHYESANDQVDLFVYKDGALVGSDEGPVSVAKSVEVPADNGDYEIVAVWNASNQHLPTEVGVSASIEPPPDPVPVRDLLPDLGSLRQRNLRFATSANLFNPVDNPVLSCYPDEIADGARQCLRFDQLIDNRGEGAVELRSAIPLDPTDGSRVTYQRIYRTDGTHVDVDNGGQWEFHTEHAHFHTSVLAASELWPATPSGERLGTAPARAATKTSFCMADIDVTHFGERTELGFAARAYKPPGCLAPSETDDSHAVIVSGISRGWLDVYDWYLEGQFIDVGGLDDGWYVLETTADPNNEIRESDETNNCVALLIHLTGLSTPAPQATPDADLQCA